MQYVDPKDGGGTLDELEVLSRAEAARIAEECRGKALPANLKEVAPSLLSAEHIRDFVIATGLISPFHLYGPKPRLKKASYEGRIGQKAYIFKDKKLVPATFTNNKLYLPANSIVFVESDLDFRLPEYVALRFNLHIEHVHRGLLLGTGPLVDPGFWGKLCIPLHNLTSEDYEISKDEGLIWLEFTRTTSALSETDQPLGVPPSTSEYWDILKFINKANKGVAGARNVVVQSSIGDALLESKNAARKAARDAKKSKIVVTAGGASLFVAAIALAFTMWNAVTGQANLARAYVDSAKSNENRAYQQLDALRQRLEEQQQSIAAISSAAKELHEAKNRILILEQQVNDLQRTRTNPRKADALKPRRP